MALNPDQQAQLELQAAMTEIHATAEKARHDHEMAMEARRARLEAVRIAKETLIENRRNQPADAREVTAADVTAYANTLLSYINN